MSFFGLPERRRDIGHNKRNPGFGQATDHFAAFSSKSNIPDEEGLDFEDTYDGLGDKLDEKDDVFNDETFGGGETVGKEFDFYGETAKVSNAINEEQMIFQRQAPKKATPKAPPKPQTPLPTDPIPDLKPEMSLWQSSMPAQREEPIQYQYQRPIEQFSLQQSGPKKFMSLEEVEAQILARSSHQHVSSPPAQPQIRNLPPLSQPAQLQQFHQEPNSHAAHIHQLLQQSISPPPPFPLDHRSSPQGLFNHLQNPQNVPHGVPIPAGGVPLLSHQTHQSEMERVRMLEDESKKLKRNHKIAQLARHNGLMTPADKNFITRIQLQQLVSVNEDSFTEDFYYQVYSAIRARNNPQQPLNQFAQTYLLHQGQYTRQGKLRRPDNHLQRMEQQVHRAVAAAKARPKTSQLVLEGSLGKISFSNVKTPRPMLNIQRSNVTERKVETTVYTGASKKILLKAIENIYDTLLELEMHERVAPPLLVIGQSPGPEHIEWKAHRDALVSRLWKETKIMDPINPTSNITHPFIAILSYAKGKKSIPRMFRHIDNEQRVTILTMIVVHLDLLSVVKSGVYHQDEIQLPASVREEIDVFAQTVLPPLLGYVSDAPLSIVIGLLSILLERVDVIFISKTKVGLAFLTMFTSRAEIIKQSGHATEEELVQWSQTYDRLFAALEPHFLECFPPPSNFVDDVYVWQFLASMAVGANVGQQHRLVGAVRDRVMDNVEASKTLPPDVGAQKAANVNLFMRAIGLDVELLG